MAFTGKAAEAAQGTSQVHQTSVTVAVRGRGAVKVTVALEPGKEPVADRLRFGNGNAKLDRAIFIFSLPAGEREAVLSQALQAARALEDAAARSEALAALARQLAGFPRATLTSLWLETISALATRSRQDLLADPHALTAALNALAGDEASAEFREITQAIVDVGRWWP
jgi:hypothetical protein